MGKTDTVSNISGVTRKNGYKASGRQGQIASTIECCFDVPLKIIKLHAASDRLCPIETMRWRRLTIIPGLDQQHDYFFLSVALANWLF